MVICLEHGENDLHMVQLMPLPPPLSLFQKIQNCLHFWYRPTQVVAEKRPLNDFMYVIVAKNMRRLWCQKSTATGR